MGAAAILAIPIGFGTQLYFETRKNYRLFCADLRSQERRERKESQLWFLSDHSAFSIYNYKALDVHYDFVLYPYGDKHFYWELVELLYKILMTGFLMLTGVRGSSQQLFWGLCFSFGMAALHTRAWPYRFDADNWLRLAAEVQIFLTLGVALTLKASFAKQDALDDGDSVAAAETLRVSNGFDWLLGPRLAAALKRPCGVSIVICFPRESVWALQPLTNSFCGFRPGQCSRSGSSRRRCSC